MEKMRSHFETPNYLEDILVAFGKVIWCNVR